MEYEKFKQEMEIVDQSSYEEQIDFYTHVLQDEKDKTKVRTLAYFGLARKLYFEGKFRQLLSSVEPYIIDYEQYEYVSEMVSIFNLAGLSSHCEGEYCLARTFYTTAMEIAQKNCAEEKYANEYNNISLAYIAEEKYVDALSAIQSAEQYLPKSDNIMGAYVYANWTNIDIHLGKLDEAVVYLKKSIEEYHAEEIIPNDILFCAANLYYQRKEMNTFYMYRDRILSSLDTMAASEVVDGLLTVFACSLDEENFLLAKEMLQRLDYYMDQHPMDSKVGLRVEEARYQYGKALENMDLIVEALQKKNAYYAKIMQSNEEQRVQEVIQYRNINKAMMKARDNEARSNRVKTQFLANMSHDIRTPINGITGMLQMVQRYRKDDAVVDDCLSKIDISAKHLLSLVNDVLDMTKLESGVIVLDHESFNLKELVDKTDEMLAFQADESGLQFFKEEENIDVNIIGSPLHLQKILVNLFGNALKYNRKDGAIYTSVRQVACRDTHVQYVFEIRDTGIGMSQDFIDHSLFEPFVQDNNVARSKYGGTGLGMSIVGQLVKKMDGDIVVKSEKGKGTDICVTLPFELDLTQHKPKVQEQKICDLHNKKILLVEDNEINMEIAEFMLEDAGAIVDKASNGKQCVDKFLQNNYDLILMDLMMPVMDGYTATKYIRESKKEDALHVPIIAMSANAYQEDVNECLSCGMNAHVSKPLFKDSFLKVITEFI